MSGDNRYGSAVSGVRQTEFAGCAEFPKQNPRTRSAATGNDYGLCPRCGNYSHRLSALGLCQACEKTVENNVRKDGEKTYIKVGTRDEVGL